MMRRALVTGGAGFVGQTLIRALLQRGDQVTAVGLRSEPQRQLLTEADRRAVSWRIGDTRRSEDLATAVDASRPDVVIHLAGVAFPPEAADAPVAAYETNIIGAARLLEVIRTRYRSGVLDPRVLVVGSGEQYGLHAAAEMPLAESAELRPLTVYAASKAAQEVLALQAFRSDGVKVIGTRSFNHSGPGHAAHYLLPALAHRAVDLPQSPTARLLIGNPDVVRDYLHVADVVDAYLRLLESGAAGEIYNVCSGEGVTVRELAATVLRHAGKTADIVVDPLLVRPVDVPILVGSPDKLQQATGWRPRRTRDDIIEDLLRSQHATSH